MLFLLFCLFVGILIVLNEGKTCLEKLLPLFNIFIPNSSNDTLHWFFEELERAGKRQMMVVCPDARYNFSFTRNNPV